MKLTRTSASQVKDFRGCARLWFFKNVLKRRPPQTEAQARGVAIHAVLEAHLKAEKAGTSVETVALPSGVTADQVVEYLQALRPLVDKHGKTGLVEHRDEIPTYEGGPKFVLIVDHAREVIVENYGVIPQIDDLKTLSDFRYCQTPDELAKDAQMVSYAKWALRLFELENSPPPNFVSVRHVYVRTRGKCIATERSRLMPPEEIEEQWQKVLNDVRAMVSLAESVEDPMVVMPSTDYCSAYGGCYFKSDCYGDPPKNISEAFQRKESLMENGARPNLLDRMRMKQNRGEAPPVAAAPAASAAPIVVDAGPAPSRLRRVASAPVASVASVAPAAPAAVVPTAPVASVAPAAVAPTAPTALVASAAPVATASATSATRASRLRRATVTSVASAAAPAASAAPVAPAVSPAVPEAPAASLASSAAPSAATTATAATAATAATSEVSDIAEVLPPDAPPRETLPDEVPAAATSVEVVEPKRGRGRPRKSAEPEQQLAQVIPLVPLVPLVPPLVSSVCQFEELFIDCLPTKGAQAHGLGEDILAVVGADAAASEKVADWRLIPYTSRGVLATAIRNRLKELPKALVVTSSIPGSDVLIEVLTPIARRVVRALRG